MLKEKIRQGRQGRQGGKGGGKFFLLRCVHGKNTLYVFFNFHEFHPVSLLTPPLEKHM